MKYIKLVINIVTSALLIATLVFLVRVTDIGLTAEEFSDKRLEIALWFGTAIAAVLVTFWIVILRIVRFIMRHTHPDTITSRGLDDEKAERMAEKIQDLMEVFQMDGTQDDIAAVVSVAVNRMHDLHCGDRKTAEASAR